MVTRLLDLPRTEEGIRCRFYEPSIGGANGNEFTFFHPDGLYSYCKTKDGDLIHPRITTKVIVLDSV